MTEEEKRKIKDKIENFEYVPFNYDVFINTLTLYLPTTLAYELFKISYVIKTNNNNFPPFFLTMLPAFVIETYMANKYTKKKAIKDLQKYRIFLSLVDKLDYIDEDLLYGKFSKKLSYDTVDSFSYREMKKLNNKVLKIRKEYGNPNDYTIDYRK